MTCEKKMAPPDSAKQPGGEGLRSAPGRARIWGYLVTWPRYQAQWRNAIRLIKSAPYRVTGDTAVSRNTPRAARYPLTADVSAVRGSSDDRATDG